MKLIDSIHSVYFIGIGGIGMSALARYFSSQGKSVGGYDKTSTEITKALTHEGIFVHYKDAIEEIPDEFKNAESTLVVYTPAIKELGELAYFQSNGFEVCKRSQVLGWVTQNTQCLAVAGTHGKTTTSAILAHLLVECKASVSAFLGGISENFGSNFILRGNEFTVVEADEFDRSFLQLSPNLACVTSMDADHLDIYGSGENLKKSFVEFTHRLQPEGSLLVCEGVDLEGISYGFSDENNYQISEVNIKEGSYNFTIRYGNNTIENVKFALSGKHNLLNALAAFAMAVKAGFEAKEVAKALATFKGVRRRFSYALKSENHILIDDYAHHPTEINALYQGVRQMHSEKQLTIVFQPHLFSRTKDFMEDFAQALSQFDRVILLDIYPAREKPIEGVSSKVLLDKISVEDKRLLSKEELLKWVQSEQPELLLMVGAGDIGAEVEHVKQVML